ncbi:MAG: 16S rRNA (guanine(527)-N(7))-methyltransferase RsmG [Deltaproteobacteria bacterium]|nr:16S rRNA (guanine(527)-N(7))-methyltransferase RsmG [Deltaproteobacteria bacterium]
MKVEELLINGAREFGIELTRHQIELFLDYLDNIKFWNKKINLTGTKDEHQVVINHFLDSISIFPFISENSKLLDIGSGAGFPGIPLKIVMPSLEVTLLDSVEKKVFFMREVIRRLELRKTQAIWGRAEDIGNGVARGYFDFVVSRAVGKVEKLLELGIPYLGEGGKIVLMRGKGGLGEWDQIKYKATQKFKLLESKEFSLPFEKHQRVILIVSSLK